MSLVTYGRNGLSKEPDQCDEDTEPDGTGDHLWANGHLKCERCGHETRAVWPITVEAVQCQGCYLFTHVPPTGAFG